jgi:hypothetical protein
MNEKSRFEPPVIDMVALRERSERFKRVKEKLLAVDGVRVYSPREKAEALETRGKTVEALRHASELAAMRELEGIDGA